MSWQKILISPCRFISPQGKEAGGLLDCDFFGAFELVAALFPGASGPLDKVDHWLAPFPSF